MHFFDQKSKKIFLQRGHKRWNYDKQNNLEYCLNMNNGCISNDFIDKENEGKLICNKQKLVELFNEHYINIVEKYSGKKPLSLANC